MGIQMQSPGQRNKSCHKINHKKKVSKYTTDLHSTTTDLQNYTQQQQQQQIEFKSTDLIGKNITEPLIPS